MVTETLSSLFSGAVTCEIPMRLPGLNEYTRANRGNKYHAAEMKKDAEAGIGWFVNRLPRITKPVFIWFEWIEKDNRRDADNIDFAKKFIFDAMVKCGKLPDDGRRYVRGFVSTFSTGAMNKVILHIKEVE